MELHDPTPKVIAQVTSAPILIDRIYQQRGGNITSAYRDANDGLNGGMRVVLDNMADDLKSQAVRKYMREVFDRHVAPHRWEEKVEIVRQFLRIYGQQLRIDLDLDNPGRYANDFNTLIGAYLELVKRTSNMWRGL